MIRWINDKLGTAAWDDPDTAHANVIDVRDLLDKSGNNQSTLVTRINESVKRIWRGETIVLCCDHGMSRSNAVAAGVLARLDGIPFDLAAARVVHAAGASAVKVELLTAVREAMGENVLRLRDEDRPNVLVTGGSGLVGSALTELAADRWDLFAPNRNEANLLCGGAALSLAVRRSRASTIVHVANPRIPVDSVAMGESLTMLKNVLDVCREERIRLVTLSGWMVYSGYKSASILASESLPLNPYGVYGETKMLFENLIERHVRTHGTQVAIIRPSMLYGGASEKPKFLFHFLRRAIKNEEIVTHRYRNARPEVDLLHVRDLARLIVKVADSDFTGDLNVGSGAGVRTSDLAAKIAALLDANIGVRHVDVDDDASNVVLDSHKAQALFGWRPEISLESGLRELVHSHCGRWLNPSDSIARAA